MTEIGACAFDRTGLTAVTIPASVTLIGSSAFQTCLMLKEIHVLSTIPPTLGTSVFSTLSTQDYWLVYVPVGYAETYKAASGWSNYADHILEEGQQPNRAMLAKFNTNDTDNEEMR